MKQALLVVSFGTNYADAEQSCIRPVEEALRRAFPEFEMHRAFTSRMILRKKREQGQCVESEEEALARLTAEKYEKIVVVPTHIIPGGEYEKVRAAAKDCIVSTPLLCEEEDLDWMADLLASIGREADRPIVWMGHGTDHAANEIYARLREKLPPSLDLACLEGAFSLDALLPKLNGLSERKLTLMPLMLVAGGHARKDLAGDAENSWKSILTAQGFDVRVRLQGLGALPAVQQRFVEKVRRALND